MPGFTRRNKPLKGTVGIGELDAFSINNPQDGQLLIYDATDAQWENGTTLSGNLVVAGTLQGGTVTSDGALTVGGAANITGNLDVVGGIETDSTLLVAGGTTLNSTLTVAGAATLSSTLGVTGLLSGGAFSFTGNGTVGGNLTVTGALSAGSLSLTDLTLTGDLSAVNGDFSGEVIVSTNLSAVNISASGGVSGATGSFPILDTELLTVDGTFSVDTTFGTPDNTTLLSISEGGTITFDVFTSFKDPGDGTQQTAMLLTPDGGVKLYYIDDTNDASYEVYRTVDGGGVITGNSTTNQPNLQFNDSAGAQVGYFSFSQAGGSTTWGSNAISQEISIASQNSGDAQTTMLYLDPDGAAEAYYSGTIAFSTITAGGRIYSTNSTNPLLEFYGNTLAREGYLQIQTSNFVLENENNAAHFLLYSRNTGGTRNLMLELDPDAGMDVYYNGAVLLETDANGIAVIHASSQPSYYMRDSAGGANRASFQAWSDNHFYMTNSTATGDIIVRTRNFADSSNITSLRITAETVATDDTTVELYHGTAASYPTPVISTVNYGARIQRGNGTGTPVLELYGPTSGNSSINFTQTTNSRAQIQYDHATELYFRTTRTGEGFRFYNDVDGTILDLNSAGSVDLYYAGNKTLGTAVGGVSVFDDSGNAPFIGFYHDDGTTRNGFLICNTASNIVVLRSEIHGAEVKLQGEDTGGTSQELLIGDPDGALDLYYAGTKEAGTVSGGFHVDNFLSMGDLSELTIATGAVTATGSFHAIDTEADAATDDLDTITFSGQTGTILVIEAANGTRTVVCKDGTGNLRLAGDFSLTAGSDKLTLIWNGAVWHELSRSDNGT